MGEPAVPAQRPEALSATLHSRLGGKQQVSGLAVIISRGSTLLSGCRHEFKHLHSSVHDTATCVP